MSGRDFAADEHRRRFGNRVRELRKGRGLTQEALAEAAGLDRAYLSNVEGGSRNPTLDVINRLATALDVEAAELFG